MRLLCAAFRARFGPVGGAKHRLENGCSFNKRMVMAKKRVVVLYGGRADEHSISCISTAGVLGAMDTER
ncbi:D-alanine--D-alanine ligase A, partial [Bifidobacterium longum]